MSDTRAAVRELGAWAAGLRWADVPSDVQDRARLVLLDTLGVTLAGARTPELAALRASWAPAAGTVRIIGGDGSAAPHDAMWLNGIASCCLEMDEGNKFVQGHPAAHVLFAVLAEAQTRPAPGEALLAAFLAGHEVASRFGRAMARRPSLHTHGHWGALGAAAAVARLRGADATATAAAIDAAAGMVVAGPWESALRGSFVRNTWIGIANVAGTVAASLSAAGLAAVDGTPDLTLGGLLGELRPEPLTEELGTRFDVSYGYFKRHSSCSYTHPPVDAVLGLRSEPGLHPDTVESILVETNGLAAPLTGLELPTRLAAMFSIPYIVAVALVEGSVLPGSFDGAHRNDPALRSLMAKVEVRRTDAMDARLPAERAARVTITTTDGTTLVREVPNPVGDADHHPFGPDEVVDKLTSLLDADVVAALVHAVDGLAESADGGALLGQCT
jgi:2-methylcitrate dehydratase PrpD